MTLVWTERARRDLRKILLYISADAPERARAYIGHIESRTQPLLRFPLRGRLIPELRETGQSCRELIVDNYRLIYRVRSQRIEILTVFHGRMQFPVLPK